MKEKAHREFSLARKRSIGWTWLPLVGFGLLCLILWRGLALDPQHLPSTQVGKVISPFSVPMLGATSTEFSSAMFHHQVSLLNVWASWCSACQEEQVFLLQLAREGQIPIYGLNYKDQPEVALQWLNEWGNPYQAIGVDQSGRIAIELGVYGAPESFLIDQQGIIRYRHAGILTAAIWQQEFLPRIRQLGG